MFCAHLSIVLRVIFTLMDSMHTLSAKKISLLLYITDFWKKTQHTQACHIRTANPNNSLLICPMNSNKSLLTCSVNPSKSSYLSCEPQTIAFLTCPVNPNNSLLTCPVNPNNSLLTCPVTGQPSYLCCELHQRQQQTSWRGLWTPVQPPWDPAGSSSCTPQREHSAAEHTKYTRKISITSQCCYWVLQQE